MQNPYLINNRVTLTYLLEKNIKIIIVRTVIITTTIILSFFIAFCVFEQGYITESFFLSACYVLKSATESI